MINKPRLYTPGPVPMSDDVLALGATQVPYFRNSAFSNLLLDCQNKLLELVNAELGSKVLFFGSSGTGAMEACIDNLNHVTGKALIVNSGGFGQRFADICQRKNLEFVNAKYDVNEIINYNDLKKINFDYLLINACETTTGRKLNIEQSGKLCRQNGALHIVDAISAFLCDPIDMQLQNIDMLIVSSNKGLALPPGLAMVILSPKAIRKLESSSSIYFDFKESLNNMERGQTPFTPPVSIILQLQFQLTQLVQKGIESVIAHRAELANYFRAKIAHLPLKNYVHDSSNSLTALSPLEQNANEVVDYFEKKHNLILTPSSGDLAKILFRVAHMGHVDKKHFDVLIEALSEYYQERIS